MSSLIMFKNTWLWGTFLRPTLGLGKWTGSCLLPASFAYELPLLDRTNIHHHRFNDFKGKKFKLSTLKKVDGMGRNNF